MMIKSQYNNRGFSLLELVVAIAIFSFGSVAMATLLIDSNVNTTISLERTNALLYAKEGMEAVRSIRDGDWSALVAGDHGLDNSGSDWVFSGSSDLIDNKFTRVVTIENVSTSTKNVSVAVAWSLREARPFRVTLDTVLTNWKQ